MKPGLLALTVLLVATGLFVTYREALLALQLGDEAFYGAAINAAHRGDPLAKVPGWYYPDTLARIWAALEPVIGRRELFLLQRSMNLVGTAAALAIAAHTLGLAAALPTIVVALLLVPTPFARSAIESGNVSGLLAGLVAVALLGGSAVWRSAVLTTTFLYKPVALPLVLSRPWREAAAPGVVAALALLDTSGRGALTNLVSVGNAALPRALWQLGLAIPWPATTAVALLLAARFARGNTGRALALGWLALPLAWEHTAILLVLPGALLGRAVIDRLQEAPRDPRRRLDLLLWLLALVLCATGKFWGLPFGPAWLSGLLGLVPPLAAGYLAWQAPPDQVADAPLRRSSSSTT